MILAATASAESMQERFTREVARRTLAGLRKDLEGPCLAREEAGQRTIAWMPYGANTRRVMGEVAAELKIAPAEIAAWKPLGSNVAIPEIQELDQVPRDYAARCFMEPRPPPAPTGSPAWRSDLDAALREAESRRVLVRVRTRWSQADTSMDGEAWSDPAVLAVVDRCFVPVVIDVSDRGEAEMARTSSLGIEGVPAWVVLDAAARPVAPPTLGCALSGVGPGPS